VLLNTKEYYLQLLEKDLKSLEENHNFKQSCGDVELLTFVQRSIVQLKYQIEAIKGFKLEKKKSVEKKKTEEKKNFESPALAKK
jgi:hypothetical protein